jgi:hypothetical protein
MPVRGCEICIRHRVEQYHDLRFADQRAIVQDLFDGIILRRRYGQAKGANGVKLKGRGGEVQQWFAAGEVKPAPLWLGIPIGLQASWIW